MQAKPTYRYRLKFTKGYPVKYVAHLDVVTTWTRAFRRADIPLAYSAGFNPQAKMQVAASLPVGYMGSAELMDIYLTEQLPLAEILNRVGNTLPKGFELLTVEEVDLKARPLQSELRQATYEVRVEIALSEADLQKNIEALLATETCLQTRIRRRRTEEFDLRPLVYDLNLVEVTDDEAKLTMRLAAGQHGNLRPDAVLKALDNSIEGWFQVERTRLIFTFDT